MSITDSRRWIVASALVVGWLALAVGVAVARAHPAAGYEVSIYRATPLAFWGGISVAWVVGLGIAVGTADRSMRWVATTLGGFAAVAVVGLPMIRGYHFFGSADSLTHLGWIRDLGAGRTTAVDLFYPGVHSIAVMLNDLAGVGYPRAAMLAVLAFAVGFFVAVPTAVWALTGSDRAAAVGAFSAFMLLPINLVVTQPVVHPITQAALFVAVVLFLLVRYLTATQSGGRLRPTALGVTLALATTGIVLYHPQAGFTLLIVFGTIAVVQFLARRRYEDGPVNGLQPVYGQTIFLAVVFVAWMARHPSYAGIFEVGYQTLRSFATGQPVPVAAQVTQRGTSLTAIGSGYAEVFAKLFLVSSTYLALTGMLFVGSLSDRLDGFDDRTVGCIRLLGVGLLALVPFGTIQFLGPLSGIVMRTLAIGMTVVTVLGAVALVHFAGGSSSGGDPFPLRAGVLVMVLGVLLALSLPAVFASPYLYQPSSHVSEQQLDGYASAFDRAATDVTFVGIRGGSARYRHAIHGTVDSPWDGETLAPEAINASLATASPSDRYLVVTSVDYEREVRVYRGLRYTSEDFRIIGSQPGIDRVQSNGEFEVFYDPGNDEG